jgi:dephospho-CoA kinase
LALVGRAFSGKKTIANQMKEVLGGDIQVLNLDDMIKEALEYISPKKQDESVAVDPKAKGKKG